NESGSIVARRLLPSMVFVLTGFGFVQLMLTQKGYLPVDLRLSVSIFLSIFALTMVIIGIGVRLNRLDALRLRTTMQLRRQIRVTNQQNRLLNEYTYITSHDLREPLATIRSVLSLMGSQLDNSTDPVGMQAVAIIGRSANRMTDLIGALLDHSRLGSGSVTVPFDPRIALTEALEDLQDLMLRTGAMVCIGKLPDTITGMPLEFRLLLQNLIANAARFSRENVPPQIRIEARALGPVGSHFQIIDNGTGILPEHSQRIFRLFQRGDNARNPTGVGIGLAHCQRIVELHGGRIWVESVPGQGSNFHFTLEL
ncbi:MAG: hypothetical protein KDK37_13520, partial [Leptospiraceae bacterium]|nr:hypothetical protein [Leptospiraceae bacterium]